MTKKLDRAYRHKNVQDLTSKDITEMLEDYRNMKAEQEEIDEELLRLQQKQTALYVVQAIVESIGASGDMKAGTITALDAFKEYAEQHGGTVRGFFRDPDLPEILQQIRDRAVQLLKERTAENDAAELVPIKDAAPAIRAEKLPLMLGKIETRIWNLLEQETTGQIVFDLAGPARKGLPAKAPAYYSINFDELDKDEALRKIVHQLTPTDKRVYIAIAGLYAAGNTSMTYTQIYYAMGKTGKPGLSDREKIESSIRKMMHAFITVNDEKAAAALGRKSYPLESPLLPAILAPMTDESRKLKGEERGRVAPLIEPPLITYARRYNQITTLPLKLLQGPISQTDAGIALEDYLLETIAHAKRNHKTTDVRTYDTIAERIRQTTSKQRARLPEKVLRLLDYYKECKHIKGYNERPDGVEILL